MSPTGNLLCFSASSRRSRRRGSRHSAPVVQAGSSPHPVLQPGHQQYADFVSSRRGEVDGINDSRAVVARESHPRRPRKMGPLRALESVRFGRPPEAFHLPVSLCPTSARKWETEVFVDNGMKTAFHPSCRRRQTGPPTTPGTFQKPHITSTAARAPGLLPGARDSPTNAQPEQVMHRRTKGQLVRKTSDRIDDQCAYFFSLAGAAVNRSAMELRQAIQERVAWPQIWRP